jgi:hypothetical protein
MTLKRTDWVQVAAEFSQFVVGPEPFARLID